VTQSNDLDAPRHAHAALLFATLVIAVCGLVYELLAGTISSYLLGDSVFQFSIVIGVFMAAMGLGAYLTRFVQDDLAGAFVALQIGLGVIGGFSAPALFFAFATATSYDAVLMAVLIGAGTLVGAEIPLVIRLLKEQSALRVNLSNVLSLDYVGALGAALAFPLILVPQLGLIRTSLVFGLANVCVGALALYTLRATVLRPLALKLAVVMVTLTLAGALVASEEIERFLETRTHSGNIIYSTTTPYQRIVVTEDHGVVNLFINGGLQFSSIDEYRYHEALVLPAMFASARHENVLILGGGDGLALRRVLQVAGVKSVTVVDLDPAVTTLFTQNHALATLNGRSFHDPRVQVINADAGKFLTDTRQTFDVIIADLPDPRDINLSRLYTRSFYAAAAKRLGVDGVLVTQATSPMYAREAFWCIAATLGAVNSPYRPDEVLSVLPYHTYVPTFGDWGFVMASPRHLSPSSIKPFPAGRFLNTAVLSSMFNFPPDTGFIDTDINTVLTHELPRYYEQGWSRWYR
jgi:spermidine synthase